MRLAVLEALCDDPIDTGPIPDPRGALGQSEVRVAGKLRQSVLKRNRQRTLEVGATFRPYHQKLDVATDVKGLCLELRVIEPGGHRPCVLRPHEDRLDILVRQVRAR